MVRREDLDGVKVVPRRHRLGDGARVGHRTHAAHLFGNRPRKKQPLAYLTVFPHWCRRYRAEVRGGRALRFGFFLQRACKRIQHAVNEAGGVLRRKLFRQFDGLVDHDFDGSLGRAQFIDREAQNRTIDHRHPLQPPVIGVRSNQRVQLRRSGHHAVEKFVRKCACAFLGRRDSPESVFYSAGLLAPDFPLKQHLQRILASF